MEKPRRPLQEFVSSYQEYTEILLSKKIYLVSHSCDEDDFIQEYKEYHDNETPPDIGYNGDYLSLEEIKQLSPEGANNKDIVIKIDRHYDKWVEISLVLRQKVDEEKYNADVAAMEQKYQAELQKYNVKKKEYEIWRLEQDIKYDQEKLERLKNS